MVASRLHGAMGGRQPVAGETVVIGEGGELVPVVVHRVHFALVGAGQAAFELEIVRRIGENQVDAAGRQATHVVDAVADQDLVEGQGGNEWRRRMTRAPSAWEPASVQYAKRGSGLWSRPSRREGYSWIRLPLRD